MIPTIVVPEIKEDERLRPGIDIRFLQEQKDRWNPEFVIDSIHFIRPDHALDRLFSIRAARHWYRDPFWFAVAVLFIAGQIAFWAQTQLPLYIWIIKGLLR